LRRARDDACHLIPLPAPPVALQHAASKNEFKADAPFLKLDAYGAALAAYAYKNIDAAVALLYALQSYSVNFGLAKGLMPNFFMALYQNDVIMEDAFQAWREDETNRTPGKEKTLQQTEKFFEYLQACVCRARARARQLPPRLPLLLPLRARPEPSRHPPHVPFLPLARARSSDEEEEDEEDEPAMSGVVRPQNSNRL